MPFWAITKHEDIVQISQEPADVFKNAPRLAVFPDLENDGPPEDLPARHLINMDPPEHGHFGGSSAGASRRASSRTLRESVRADLPRDSRRLRQ